MEIAVEQGLEYVDYDFKFYQKQYLDLAGKAFQYKVYTATLKNCQRGLYQALKKEFKQNA